MAQELVHLTGGARGRFARADWRFTDGEQWAVVGEDGAAKAHLCALVAGLVPPPHGVQVVWDETVADRVRLVSFAQQAAAAEKGGFRQARYYSIEDEAGPGDTVEEVLSFNRIYDVNPFEVGRPRRADRRAYAAACRRMVELVGLASPRLLVLDDPCAGLDPARRAQVKQICAALAAEGLSLLVAVRRADEMPDCITRVLTVEKGRLAGVATREPTVASAAAPVVAARTNTVDSGATAPPVVELKDIRLKYGRRKLFDGFSWTIRRGERWVLRGANGSGKTTLLALLTGDNPQAYANDVTVFGLKREPGVELARVRRRIGMVSPEQQAYEGRDACELLEAALARRPSLLLLDEPCLNLDARAAERIKKRIAGWLRAHPACTAVCVAHRPEDVPPGFNLECRL